MQKYTLVLARPIEVWADSFNDAVIEAYDSPSSYMELHGLAGDRPEIGDYDSMTMPSTDQAVANGKALATKISAGWRELADHIKNRGPHTPESDAYAAALEACATTLQNSVRREGELADVEKALTNTEGPLVVSVEFVFARQVDDDYLELTRVQRGALPEGVEEYELYGIGERFAQGERYQVLLAQVGNVIDGGEVLAP